MNCNQIYKNTAAKNTQVKRNHQTQSKQAEYRGTKNIKCCSKHSKHTRNFNLRLRHKNSIELITDLNKIKPDKSKKLASLVIKNIYINMIIKSLADIIEQFFIHVRVKIIKRDRL